MTENVITEPAPYDASSIRILEDHELDERWLWTRAAALAREHPHVPESFIRRLLEACELSRTPEDLAVARYLRGDRTVEVPPELIACHTELAREIRR